MTPHREVVSWHEYFLQLATHVATRSKHPRTQHGAVIVDQHKRIVATGYNGGPAGFPDKAIDWSPGMTWTSKDWTIHAEENALLYAGMDACRGCVIYVTGLPCPRCALRIIHCGIRDIICGSFTYSKMKEDWELLKHITELAGARLLTVVDGKVKEVGNE